MSRTLRLKLLYLVLLIALGGASLYAITQLFSARSRLSAIVAIIVLLIPGRIQGMLYRDLFRGRRLHDAGEHERALTHFVAFRQQLAERPWKKAALFLTWTVYTTDAGAMVENNIAAALLMLGRWDEARQALERALALDGRYPLPHVNLAQLALIHGNREQARRCLQQAAELGYHGTPIDRLIENTQALLAKLEGRAELGESGPPGGSAS